VRSCRDGVIYIFPFSSSPNDVERLLERAKRDGYYLLYPSRFEVERASERRGGEKSERVRGEAGEEWEVGLRRGMSGGRNGVSER